MTSALDLAALSRKELQSLAKEFQLCRGNAKNDVLLQHVQDFVAANPSDGETRVRGALGLAVESAATAPSPPAKQVTPKNSKPEPVAEKKSPAPAIASPAATKAKAEKTVTPRKEETAAVAAKFESAKKTPETKAARKSPAKSDAAPVVTEDAKKQKKKTPEKKTVTSSPVVSAKKAEAAAPPATKQTPPKKAPVQKSPAKETPAKKSPAKENPKDVTPKTKAGRPALASLDANVVKSSKVKKGGKVTVDSLVSSIDDLAFAGDGSKVRCTTTGHEMKADVDVITTYINGKSYLKAKLKKQSFSSYAPMFVAHPDEKKAHLLWCNVTETEHPRDVARVEAHIAGVRYQKDLPRWKEEEAARVKAQKEAEAKKAARAKARAEKLKQLESGSSSTSTASSSGSKKRKERPSSSSKKSATEAVVEQEETGEKKAKRPRQRKRAHK